MPETRRQLLERRERKLRARYHVVNRDSDEAGLLEALLSELQTLLHLGRHDPFLDHPPHTEPTP